MESFVYQELNRASRYGDVSYLSVMGPYAAALYEIIFRAGTRRKDIDIKRF
jgi:hypothetical protein